MSDTYTFKNGIHIFDVTDTLSDEEYNSFGMGIIDFLHKTICAGSSKSDIRRLIKQNALKINDMLILWENARIAIDKTVDNHTDHYILIHRKSKS